MADQDEKPDERPDERIASFQLLAETAQRLAETADTESARADYLKIAKGWLQAVTEIEQTKKE
jgi:predicted Zn-dependent protease